MTVVMNSELFQPTIPVGEPELMRASAYQRYLDELHADPGGISTRISQLSPSLRADLLRFGHDGGGPRWSRSWPPACATPSA